MINLKIFGKHPAGERLERINASPNYRDGQFQCIEPTFVMLKGASRFQLLKNLFFKPKDVRPPKAMPSVKTDLHQLQADKPAVVWFGHSSYLIKSKGVSVLVDPVFSGYASPVKFFGEAFLGADVYGVDDFPAIDILVLTHDHYDHLDFETILQIHPKVKKIITSLGVGSHLEFWDIDKSKIVELDWWDEHLISDTIKITATPARHFSGRGLVRAKTLWSSFALQLHGYKIFIGGDSGYDHQFKIIGDRFQGFDLAFLECGQYGEAWPDIHMTPEETVTAAKALNAAVVLPVHWGKFTLSYHAWNAPVRRFVIAAQEAKQDFVMPTIGQPFILGKAFEKEVWWDF